MAQQAIELLDVQPGDRVLEVGFGPGVAIQMLAHSTSAQSVTGTDPSRRMFEQAQARNAEVIEAGKVTLWQGPVERLCCRDSTFDKALAIRSLQLWPDPAAGLQEIQRALRPGGRIVLGFTRHSGQTNKGLTGLLSAAGFTGVRVVNGKSAYFAFAIKPGGTGATPLPSTFPRTDTFSSGLPSP